MVIVHIDMPAITTGLIKIACFLNVILTPDYNMVLVLGTSSQHLIKTNFCCGLVILFFWEMKHSTSIFCPLKYYIVCLCVCLSLSFVFYPSILVFPVQSALGLSVCLCAFLSPLLCPCVGLVSQCAVFGIPF